MKRRVSILITAILMVLGLSLLFTACDDNAAAKSDYSVTVLSPDDEPVSGATVSWMNGSSVAGSAQTDESGKATATLPVGTYGIELSGYGDGYEYTSVSVGSSMRNITLTLSVKRVVYSVTVTDKDGAAAEGISVSWSDDDVVAGTAKTNASGKAECELDYGSYSVTLSDLPEGNLYDGAKTADGKNPALSFTLRGGASVKYSVTVRSEGGLLFADQAVQIFSGETRVASGSTDEKGVFAFTAEPGDYTVRTTKLQEGYSYEPATLTSELRETVLELHSEIIMDSPAEGMKYVMGDIIHNYSFTTPYELGDAVWSSTVSEILQSKEMLIISNWGTNCSWCVKEMPMMEEVYQKYGDKIEIVAVSNYVPMDTDAVIINYYAQNGYTFPMMRDANGFAYKFGLTGWPTTVVIDRYGAVARIEAGAITSTEAWERLILKYIGDDYVQTFIPGTDKSDSINNDVAKPDLEIPEGHYENVANKLNDTSTFPKGAEVVWFGEEEYEYAWPFLLDTVDGVSQDGEEVLYATNSGKPNTMAIIYATVNVEAGKVFTFDYFADTETADYFYAIWDGRIVLKLSGNSQGWQTCHLFSDITGGEHRLSITYVKDSSGNVGRDSVYLRNVRFVDVSELSDSTDMLRAAAYGTPENDSTSFPYYADVFMGSDGYYHVNLAGLQNHELAGNDQSPLLLANVLNVTNWVNNYSLAQLVMAQYENTGEYVYSCTFEVNGVTRDYRNDLVNYMNAATASDVDDCIPIDAFLHDLLVGFTKNVSGSESHENEWLELCYFYSHYGSGDPVGNPIIGVTEKTAIVVEEGTHTADLTRNMYPFPSIVYTFTPKENAVYKVESLIPAKDAGLQAAQIWIYDEETIEGEPLVYCGDTHITLDGVNEHNFEAYYYMQAGHKYYFRLAFQMAGSGKYDFKITNVGQSATEFITCSNDIYEMVLDEEGNFTNEIVLSGAIDYVLGEDGYFRAVNPDGTTGDYIYMDVIRVSSSALGNTPLNKKIDKFVLDPKDFKELDYKVFDFRYCIAYYNEKGEDGSEIINYNPKLDLSLLDSDKYKDYTEIMRAYIEAAPTEGEYKGLIKVNQELVDIISLFFEVRLNSVWDDTMEAALENEWLRLCWYNRTHNEANP